MEYKIIRGQNQIGGTITEIITDKARVWIDFGMELSVKDSYATDEFMIEAIKENPPDAVLFTHIHGDHIGLLYAIPEDVKIYLGPVGLKLLKNIRETLLAVEGLDDATKNKLEKEMEILKDEKRVTCYKDGESLYVNDEMGIKVTPFQVDHSVADAYMLRFEANGKCIVHTGDFRGHGRKGENLLRTVEKIATIPVNTLIIEGTMMSRSNEKEYTEEKMQEEAEKIIKKHKYAFLICSSINMESLASFYWATVKSGEKGKTKPIFMVNGYVKKQLDLFTEIEGKEDWRFRFHRSYAMKDALNYKLKNGKTQKQHMLDEGFVMMVGTSDYYKELMEEFREYNPILIYSMWNGYLKEGKDYANKELIDVVNAWKPNVVYLHTSGHASPDTIAKVIEKINPSDAIVPIHTENAKGFRKLEISPELRRKVMSNNYNKLYINKTELPYSSKIKCEEKPNNAIRIYINDTTANMQVDSADFESIIVSIWAVDRNKKIELGYKEYIGDNDNENKDIKWESLKKLPCYKDNKGNQRVEPARLHYMRFLYRVMKFRQIYGNEDFMIDVNNLDEINRFESMYNEMLKAGNFWITKPTIEGGLKGFDKESRKIKEDMEVTENHLEKWFVLKSKEKKLPKSIKTVFGDEELYDQLPCSMFYGEPSCAARIFNAGCFDLWGINSNRELSVFELKKADNDKLGIISELFFYSNLMKDMKIAAKNKYTIRKSYRGFKKFVECENDKKVNAYFLAPKLHSFFDKNRKGILDVLNEANDGITYSVIDFSYSDIVPKIDNKESEDSKEYIKRFKKELFEELSELWKKYN